MTKTGIEDRKELSLGKFTTKKLCKFFCIEQLLRNTDRKKIQKRWKDSTIPVPIAIELILSSLWPPYI